MVLNDELVLAAERAALRVEALDGERRAVVDEGAADGEGTGVDVDDAELDGVLRQRAAARNERQEEQRRSSMIRRRFRRTDAALAEPAQPPARKTFRRKEYHAQIDGD